METQVYQYLLQTQSENTGDLSCAYIGTLKRKFAENPSGFSANYVSFSLNIPSDYIIDNTSVVSEFEYWKQYTALLSLVVASTTKQLTGLTLAYTEKIKPKSTLVCLNGSNQIIFSTVINDVAYSGSNIISLSLDMAIPAGSYNIKMISKIKEIVPCSFNSTTKVVTPNWNSRLFLSLGFTSVISSSSEVTYYASNKSYFITSYSSYDSSNLDLEANERNVLGMVIKNHFNLSSAAINVIHLPDESYFSTFAEDIEKESIKYMIMPINLSKSFNLKLFELIKSLGDNYHSLIISTDLIESKDILSFNV